MHSQPLSTTATPAQPISDTADAALFLLPSRYEDRTRITPIGALLPGQRAVIEGEVQLVAYQSP